KLTSFEFSNSAACLSFMIERASSIVCVGLSVVFDTGVIRPSTLIAGGKLAVMNRSDAFCLTTRVSRSWMNLVACSRSIRFSLVCRGRSAEEQVLVDGHVARLADRDEVAPDQLLQVLVKRVHAVAVPGLDHRVH